MCFPTACTAHDACYATCGTRRSECDNAFFDDLRAVCSAHWSRADPRSATCEGLAYIYWQAVVRRGAPFFQAAQDYICSPEGLVVMNRRVVEPQVVDAPFEDLDDDLLPDAWERQVGCDPLDPRDVLEDFDGDGLNNLQEYLYDTDPRTANTGPSALPQAHGNEGPVGR